MNPATRRWLVVLRIAVPERGVVASAARSLLEATGYGSSPASLLAGPSLLGAPVKVFRLPERDIPMYAAEGGLHLALTGSLSLLEASMSVPVALDLEVGTHELALFTSADRIVVETDLGGARVATPLPNLVRRHLATEAIATRRVVPLDPAEHAVSLGIADAVAVVVDPHGGPSLSLAGMRRLGRVRAGHLVVVEGRTPGDELTRIVKAQVLARLRAAGRSPEAYLLQYDCPSTHVEETVGLAGSRRPAEVSTLSPGWSTVRLLVARDRREPMVDRLLALGCREVVTFVPSDHRAGAPERATALEPREQQELPVPRRLPDEGRAGERAGERAARRRA